MPLSSGDVRCKDGHLSTDEPTLEPLRQAAIETAHSLSALAAVCTVPVWVPTPWPEDLAPAEFTFSRWSPHEVDYCIVSDRHARPRLSITGKAPTQGGHPGENFQAVHGMPWNAYIADDSVPYLDDQGSPRHGYVPQDRCWAWCEPPGVRLMIRADGIAAEQLVEIVGALQPVAPPEQSA